MSGIQSWWGRVVSGVQAGLAAYNKRALVPSDQFEWNSYQSRLFRYALYEAFYNAIVYTSLVLFAARYKFDNNLYKFIRSVYNVSFRIVEAYVAKIYGGQLDFEDLSRGAIPITQASDSVKEGIKQLWIDSNWQTEKSLFVRYGAMLGDVGLKVVDDIDREKVRLEVLHPGKIKEAEFDAIKNVKSVTIEYYRFYPDGIKTYRYTEKIDKEQFQFFKDGKPWDYINDIAGGEFAQYPNPYGFVPLVITKHKDMGQIWGANAYHTQVGKINELNDAASLLADQIRKAVNVIWYYAGVRKKEDLDASTDDKDQIPAMYGPDGSQPFPMIANIDITAAGGNIDRMQSELERDLPELALHRLRESGNLTAPGVRAAYSDAIDRFTEAQGVYDDGLIRAQKMALTIGGLRKYKGYESFGLDSYEHGDLDHYINLRPIVVDELSKMEKIQALQTLQAPKWLILRELDFDQDTIDEVMAGETSSNALPQPGQLPMLPPGQQPVGTPENGKPPVNQENAPEPQNGQAQVTPDSFAQTASIWEQLGMLQGNGSKAA